MMPLHMAPDFDGAKWRCPCCGACLATVVQVEQFDAAAMEGFDVRAMLFQSQKKRIVAALELPNGFVNKSGLWLRPSKLLPSNRGAHNASDRTKKDAHTRRQWEQAQRKNDVASIVEAEHKLRQVEERRFTPSEPRSEGEAPRLFAEQLPVSIRCPKVNCARVVCLEAIKGPISHKTATGDRKA